MANIALGPLAHVLSLLLLYRHFLHHLKQLRNQIVFVSLKIHLFDNRLDSIHCFSAFHVNLAVGVQSEVLLQLLLGGQPCLAHHTLVPVQLKRVLHVRLLTHPLHCRTTHFVGLF